MGAEPATGLEWLASALSGRAWRRIPDSACDARAAVALIVRPDPGPVAADPAPGGPALLFVQRAEVEGDPWSGHMAFPGGRHEAGDEDLLATAIRETREETSLRLSREDVLGALDEAHPWTRHLPSIAVTPFVAWYEGDDEVRASDEVRDHVWVPLSALRAREHRSAFTLRRGDRVASFPTIEYAGYTVWGLTFEIVRRFLEVVGQPDPRNGGGAGQG